MRPNYIPNFEEQRRLQPNLLNDRQLPPINDGFALTDNSAGRGQVIAVDGQSRADYDRMVGGFKYTQDNYREAYKEAARTGKPVVAIFGGFENNNSRQLIESTLPDAKSGASKDAVYVYIDRAKCKNPEMAQFAESQLAGGHNAAVSIVFSVKPGENGRIQPEEPNFRWQGADRAMIGSFNQAVSEARSKQESYKGQFDPEVLKEKPSDTNSGDRTEKIETGNLKFREARNEITQGIRNANQAKDWHDAERSYHAAIDAADKITPQEIQAERKRISDAISSTAKDTPEFQKLLKESADLNFVQNAKSATRADLGLACLRWSNQQTDEQTKQKFREIAAQWIDSAARRDTSIYSNPALHERLNETGIPKDELQALMPKLILDSPPRRDLFQYGGGIRPDHLAPPPPVPPDLRVDFPSGDQANKEPPRPNRVESDTPPPDKTERAKPKERTLEETERIIKEDEAKAVKTEAEFQAALADAKAKNLPVIVKVGAEFCAPCKRMAPSLKQAEQDLKGRAVMIRVLVENTPELASALGADQGVPITKVAAVVAGENGKPTLETLAEKSGFTAKDQELETFLNDNLPRYEQWRRRNLASIKR